MKIKYFLTLFFVFSVASKSLYAQEKKSIPSIEKIYIHTDRSTYIIGESLWYKAYSVYAYNNILFNKSNVLYVELISPDSKIIARNKTRLEDGLAHGDFKLSDSIGFKSGVYQLRAYTNWNRNFGEDFIFKKEIEILDVFKNTNVASQENLLETKIVGEKSKNAFKVQFFPEGGSLLENVSSIMAFKATDLNGNPIKVQGKIFNSNGDVISLSYSVHDGMGKFILKPNKGMQYYAEMTSINKDKIKVDLPKANQQGYLLSVRKIKEKEVVTIKTNKQTLLERPNEKLTLNCSLKGVSYFKGTQPLNTNALSFELATTNFPEGIFQLTLYDEDFKPQSERLKYIDKNDTLLVKITPDKKIYKPKEKVTINLSSKSNTGSIVPASYSISSIDLNGLDDSGNFESNISSYFLMESDIRGKVYNPNYYFDASNSNRLAHLDLLLLTQGWRDFIWKKMPIFKDSIAYEAEKGIKVSGVVKSLFGDKNRENYTVNLMLVKNGNSNILNSGTDSLGRFEFKNMVFNGDAIMMLNSSNEKGKNRGRLVLDSLSTPIPAKYKRDSLVKIITKSTNILKENIYNKYIKFGVAPENVLNEIEITAKKKEEIPSLYGTADRSYTVNEKTQRFSSIFQLIQFTISGITAVGGKISFNRFNEAPYILVDGTEWSQEELAIMQPDDVAKIEAIIGAGISMFGTRGANGVLIIYTKEGKVNKDSKKVYHSITQKIEGFYDARVFYANDSEEKEIDPEINSKNAIRNTLYWNPYFHPNEKGVSTVNYFNNEVETKVKLKLEGITVNGIPVVTETYYITEK
jgi:hypothetical protein